MRTVSVRELKSNPSEALRDAREGPVLVLNRGLPEALVVSVMGERGSTRLQEDVSEAVGVILALAEGRGTRAVRAVDRATVRRAAEQPAPYASGTADLSLATLAATLQAIAGPRRIVRRREADATELETVVLVVDRELGRSDLGRIDAAAAAAGRRVIIQCEGDQNEYIAADDEVVFNREDIPVRSIDRMIAEGRARPALRQLPFPPPLAATPGISLVDDILRERAEDPR